MTTTPTVPRRLGFGGIGRALNELTIIVGFLAISLYLAATTPAFLSTANILSILLASSLIGIVAVGETFVIVTGGIDLSVGSVPTSRFPPRWRSASASVRSAGRSTRSPSRC